MGVLVIGTIGLMIIAAGFAISHIVTAVLQKRMRVYVANGIVVLFLGYLGVAGAIQIPMMQQHLLEADHPKGADNSFDLLAFGVMAILFLLLGGLATLANALAHRKFKQLYRDNLITAIIMLAFGLAELLIPGNGVAKVGFFNAACIFLAIHLAISAASPRGISAASPKA